MPVKIRLARHGRKAKPFYHIVIADGRAPRDGKYIERVGSYNPNTNPATIDVNFDKTLDWLQKGAQPTDTVKAILSHKGIIYMNHLLKGVKKGAFTEEVAKERFNDWMEEKETKIQAKTDKLKDESIKERKARLAAESKVNEARAEAIAAKQSELAADAEAKAAEAAAETAAAAATEVVKDEVVTTEEVKVEVKEEVKKEE